MLSLFNKLYLFKIQCTRIMLSLAEVVFIYQKLRIFSLQILNLLKIVLILLEVDYLLNKLIRLKLKIYY